MGVFPNENATARHLRETPAIRKMLWKGSDAPMSVNEVKTDRRQLRSYLLGRLPEDQAVYLDSRLFAADALRQELEDEQDSLIEDFVYQRLTEEDERTVLEQCATSQPLREKVASLRVLLAALERQPDSSPVPFSLWLKRLLLPLSPALALLLCLAAFLYVRGRHKNAPPVSNLATLSAPTKEGAPTSAQGRPTVVAFLSANVARGPSSVPAIKFPPTGTVLELQVEVRSPASTAEDWDVSLLRNNEVIQSSTDVRLHQLGQETYLSLIIDSTLIRAGSYSVRYSPHTDPKATRYRSFQGIN
jgi:hypothetical protein